MAPASAAGGRELATADSRKGDPAPRTKSTIGGPIRRSRTRYVKPFEFDPNPLYAAQPGAFDPRYGPETQEQIDWHLQRGTPGAKNWEVGKPAKPYDRS